MQQTQEPKSNIQYQHVPSAEESFCWMMASASLGLEANPRLIGQDLKADPKASFLKPPR